MRWTSVSLVVLVALGCGGASHDVAAQRRPPPAPPPPWQASVAPAPVPPAPTPPLESAWDAPYATLRAAAERASPGGRRVLETTRAMLDEETIVRGSCFGWTDAVYHRAGGPSHDAFRGSRHGPYADPALLQPGDWAFFINHSWGEDTHSAIFVAWVDERAHTALMVSYAGGRRDEAGRFGDYELTSVYRIVRMVEEPPAQIP